MFNTKPFDYLLEVLLEYFQNKGYKLGRDSNYATFYKERDHITFLFFINYQSDRSALFSKLILSNSFVERYIMEIGGPNLDLSFISGWNKLFTVRDRQDSKRFEMTILGNNKEVELVGKSYIEYFEKEIISFSKYEYLPAILSKMDILRSKGLYWKEILDGGPEHLIKGLIISKLCNDPNYQEKLDWIGGYFESKGDEWSPYWKKYETLLKDIQPKYNLS